MPDYDLGNAHGTVSIDYDGSGIRDAKKDMDGLAGSSDRTSTQIESDNEKTRQSYEVLGQVVRKLAEDVARHGAAEEVAKSRVAAAESRLTQVRQNSASTVKQIADAERAVAQAQSKSQSASQRLAASTDALRNARTRLAAVRLPSVAPEADRDSSALDRLRSHLENIDKQTRKSSSGLNTFTGRTKLLAAGVAIAIPGVASLGVSLVALTGLAGVAAGALAALGATAATLATGISGIGDVFKAASADEKAAGGAAASSAKQQRSAAQQIEQAKRSLADAEENLGRVREDAAKSAIQAERAITTAQKDLINAQRDALRAQESLTKARAEATRQLEDMRLALTGGALDERQALLDVQDAQDALNKVMSDPTANDRDRQQAILNLEKQQYALEQARVANQRLAEDEQNAAAKGVEGSDAVVNAQDAVRDANDRVAEAVVSVADAQEAARQQQIDSARAIREAVQAVEDAQRQLQDAYADAAEAAAGGASKTADAMKNISPNARDVVSEILGLKDAWQAVKFSVQDRLFAGLADDVKPLATKYFPLLEEGMGGIADGLNGIIQDVVAFAQTSEATDNIRQIFTNTGLAVKSLRTFVTDLLAAFLDIAAVGSDFLPGLASGASDAANSFRDFISEARDSGKLKEWMQGGIDAAQKLWELLKNVGSIIATVFKAFDQEGGGALNTLTALTGQVDRFLKSAEGQDALHALGRILASIGGASGKVFLSFLDAAASILVALEPLITAFADAAGTYLAGAIQVALVVLKPLADILGFLGPALGPVVAGIYAANKAVQAAQVVWKGLNVIMKANPFLLIASVIITLVLLIIQNWDSISKFLSDTWTWISNLAVTVWTAIADFFTGLWTTITTALTTAWNAIGDFFSSLWSTITGAVRTAWTTITSVFQSAGDTVVSKVRSFVGTVVDFFKELPGKIWDFISSLPGKFVQFGKDIISGIVRGLGNAASWIWDKLKSIVSTAWNNVKDFFGISSPSKLAMYAGEMVGQGLANGIAGSVGAVSKAADTLSQAAAIALPGMTGDVPVAMALNATAQAQNPVGLSLPAATSTLSRASGNSQAASIYVDNLTLQVAGNLDPTNAVAWRRAMVSIKDGIRQVDKDYS